MRVELKGEGFEQVGYLQKSKKKKKNQATHLVYLAYSLRKYFSSCGNLKSLDFRLGFREYYKCNPLSRFFLILGLAGDKGA